MGRRQQKISVTISPELLSGLDYLSRRLGVSRSALISDMLSEPVGAVVELFQTIPEDPQPADVVRFRGDSAEVVRERLAQLRTIGNDLLSELGGAE